MKVLMDIKDSKVSFVMELLNSLSFVTAKSLTDEKAELINDVQESIQEFKQIKEGKLKGIPAIELLEEL